MIIAQYDDATWSLTNAINDDVGKVVFTHLDSAKGTGRIDLYKKHCFIMEAKQSREADRGETLSLRSLS